MSDNPNPVRRVLLVLGGTLVLATLVVLVLAFLPKSTIVEFTLQVKQVSFTVPAPRPPDTAILFFDPGLKVTALQWKGADNFLAATGSSAAPADTMRLPRESPVSLSSAGTFHPLLRLRGETRLSLQPFRQDRILLALTPAHAAPHVWQNSVESGQALRMRWEGSSASSAEGSTQEADWAPSHPPVFFSGGSQPAELGLRLPAQAAAATTVMQVIAIESGQASEPKHVPIVLPEAQLLLPAGDRLIFLKKEKDADGVLLCDNLAVRAPEFYRLSGFQEESFLLGGQVRFPAKEKEPMELERDFFLRIESAEPLRLKALRLRNSTLELVLWGKPRRVELGPTLGLSNELLPSYFTWLYTHRLGTLIFSTLTGVVTACLGLLKLIGMLKS